MSFSLFVSCAKGLEYLLETELRELGLNITAVNPQGVYVEAELALIYKICLWSRLASRVQLILFSGPAENQPMLYQLCHDYAWETLFLPSNTVAVEFHGTSSSIRNSMFGAQVVKDAMVDYFRNTLNQRPIVSRDNPDILIHAHLKRNTLTVSFDLTGYSLHQRGYRLEQGKAPLKENIAAAMLIRAKWPEIAAQDGALYDPFCGSGTLVIEAALMAMQKAPGLFRHDQAFKQWVLHDQQLWETLQEEARLQAKSISNKLLGSDNDPKAIAIATANAKRAGVDSMIEFSVTALEQIQSSPHCIGLLISNPPYGERLSDEADLMPTYGQLGKLLSQHYSGWTAAILTANPQLAKAIGLRSEKQYTLYTGALACQLYRIAVTEDNRLWQLENRPLSSGAEMFTNRLRKNYTHLAKWAKRNQITCYRVYDADLPEYAYAIDIYNDYAVLQEYAPPATIDQTLAEIRRRDVYQVVPSVLNIPATHVVIKQRKQQKGLQQYQKMNQTERYMSVKEGEAQYYVNLFDYLDTGVFLDHRPLRLRFRDIMPGMKFLNCFCYTATASIQAALAGAFTTNVDLSNTYLTWAEKNFKLNHLTLSRHQFIQDDCKLWLKKTRDKFDVIFLDPPSFSNSKRMLDVLDIQRDHESLIDMAMHVLKPTGKLYFSTNLRQFKLAPSVAARYQVKNITAETIDFDFKRDQRIHHCFIILHPQHQSEDHTH